MAIEEKKRKPNESTIVSYVFCDKSSVYQNTRGIRKTIEKEKEECERVRDIGGIVNRTY
jgi:hypothetical protein